MMMMMVFIVFSRNWKYSDSATNSSWSVPLLWLSYNASENGGFFFLFRRFPQSLIFQESFICVI
jgi:hypothetical protein